MRQALAILVAIFNPLGALVQLIEVVLAYLRRLDAVLETAELAHDLRETPEGRRAFEAGIAFAEHWLSVIIAARACEIGGRRVRLCGRWTGWQPAKARGWDELMQRYARVRAQLGMIERLAQRRAARMQRALSQNPLRLAPSAQSTSPSLRLVEATHRSLASLSAQHWGRWIARSCAQDGGGSRVRGPPLIQRDCRLPIALQPSARSRAFMRGVSSQSGLRIPI